MIKKNYNMKLFTVQTGDYYKSLLLNSSLLLSLPP